MRKRRRSKLKELLRNEELKTVKNKLRCADSNIRELWKQSLR
jgi:hypothetical protein